MTFKRRRRVNTAMPANTAMPMFLTSETEMHICALNIRRRFHLQACRWTVLFNQGCALFHSWEEGRRLVKGVELLGVWLLKDRCYNYYKCKSKCTSRAEDCKCKSKCTSRAEDCDGDEGRDRENTGEGGQSLP